MGPREGDAIARLDVDTMLEVMVVNVVFKNRGIEEYRMPELRTGAVKVENVVAFLSVSVT